MHFQKSARQWWASLRANGEAPRTWKNLRVSIMKQFLSSDAKDKVLTEWQTLKLTPYESIQKYVDKFWDLHLKATVYRKIDFEEQKQQFCAGLPEDMNEYVNSQKPKTISAVIHHAMVAAKINFQQGAKRNLKPIEIKEKHEHKGKNQPPNSSKGNSSNNKAKEKGVYKGKNRLTPEELERYRKDNRCFKCGEQVHAYRACPQRYARNEQPRASIIEAPKEDVHCKGSPLSYVWGKVREHDAFILSGPGSTHNFISHELAAKLGIQEFEMGDAMKADGAFIGQDASVTPLIGKLRLHIQGYVDKEDFFISPLKHEDVILGAPWFDRLAASIKFLERRISFKFREKDMYIDAQESCEVLQLCFIVSCSVCIPTCTQSYIVQLLDVTSEEFNGVLKIVIKLDECKLVKETKVERVTITLMNRALDASIGPNDPQNFSVQPVNNIFLLVTFKAKVFQFGNHRGLSYSSLRHNSISKRRNQVMASRRGPRGNDGTETKKEPQYQNEETGFDLGRRDIKAALSNASARSSSRRIVKRAQRRAHRLERGRREEEDLIDTSRRSKAGRDGLTRVKHKYHMERVTKSKSDTANDTKESDHSRWRMEASRGQ
ncbi:hypothetical protein L7F22_005770 [Adiantum nelumboides]|nr:hypothetical protein [Adiantum nelumboides]